MIVPFGIFLNDEVRLGVFFAFFGLQLVFWDLGQFFISKPIDGGLSTLLISNTYLTWLMGTAPEPIPAPLTIQIVQYVGGATLLFLQVIRMVQEFLPNSWCTSILYAVGLFHLANRYCFFGVMTTERFEIVVEGSQDGHVWKEYLLNTSPVS